MRLIGQGTTRDTYLLESGLVKKVYTHPIGYKQSLNEKLVYDLLPPNFKKYFSKIYEVTEEYQISSYIPSYTSPNEDPIDLLVVTEYDEIGFPFVWDTHFNYPALFPNERFLMRYLQGIGVVIDELYVSTNFGIQDNHIVFFDYGMTDDLLCDFTVCLDNGEIPYYYFEDCPVCNTSTRHIKTKTTCGKCMVCGTSHKTEDI